MIREIRFYKNYFIDFYISRDSSTQEKIEFVFKVIVILFNGFQKKGQTPRKEITKAIKLKVEYFTNKNGDKS